ncbi:MAG: hypothetical protein K2L17_12695 [Muribaculaceae bacterium]|nr:hypothetical protein [Muribaculaceae bacterium]
MDTQGYPCTDRAAIAVGDLDSCPDPATHMILGAVQLNGDIQRAYLPVFDGVDRLDKGVAFAGDVFLRLGQLTDYKESLRSHERVPGSQGA